MELFGVGKRATMPMYGKCEVIMTSSSQLGDKS
jgi:hypothetical protein